jgi:saccharopine dehydrogenase-like NADP-dependent oxidoreductase
VKHVLVLGAGKSSPYLIDYLLRNAEAGGWRVTVGDVDESLARQRVGDHARGEALPFDVNDETQRGSLIKAADVVVNMLGPMYQDLIAWDCVAHGKHLLSVSYRDQAVRSLDADARKKDVLLLFELGLDPGIDHMSSMQIIDRVREKGGKITAFRSYGSGVPAPGQDTNPLQYVITWNPRNVVMSAEHGAQYMEDGAIKCVPWHHVFLHTWNVQIDGVGEMEAYPNRDSLSYMQAFGLDDVETMIRGTLRYPGWSETWAQIVRLGLPNEHLRIPDLASKSYRDVTEMFLPLNHAGPPIESRLARFLQISPTGRIMQNLKWLGLLSDEPTRCRGDTAAAMLVDLLSRKLPLGEGHRDMVILMHSMDVEYPDRPAERITSTFTSEGTAGNFTAMAISVGLPTALAVKHLLDGGLKLRGSRIPTEPEIYEPILVGLEQEGLEFRERVEIIG